MGPGKSTDDTHEDDDDGFYSGFRDDLIPSIRQSGLTPLRRRDSTFSAATDYKYASRNDLAFWQGVALLTADCLGTGVLALPGNMKVLGWSFGLSFLVLNVPINLYAGTILSNAAGYVERKQKAENKQFKSLVQMDGLDDDFLEAAVMTEQEGLFSASSLNYNATASGSNDDDLLDPDKIQNHHLLHHDTATFDFIGMTSALFQWPVYAGVVMALFYLNIFLVLGDYILVMSHAVSALLGEDWLCIPQAGLIASTLMFAVSQLRTMANLGRTASIISLSCLLIVILQCIYYSKHDGTPSGEDKVARPLTTDFIGSDKFNQLRKLSSMGSIGFAMGSQKLLLNIRHELADRASAPRSLAVSLTIFASFYVLVVIFSGPSKIIMRVLWCWT